MSREIKFRAWNGDDSISHKDGEYIYVKAEWHPNKNGRGYVKRHRLVLERKLGFYIPKKTIVHHIDGNKFNDSVENLELIPTQKLHAKSHDNSVRNTNGTFVASDPIFSEIKFRLFNKHTKQYEIYNLSKLIRTTFRNSQFSFAGRYTGLKDKNGVDIYESDVCRILYTDWPSNTDPNIALEDYLISISNMGIIKYEAPEFGILLKFRYHNYSLMSLNYGSHGFIEVIGNIHQHPELIDNPPLSGKE